jgi:hypothetical protein
MIPSGKWFPTSLSERATWFQNFANKFDLIGPTLGFAPSVLTQVQNDNTLMQFLASSAVDVDTFSKAMTAYRKEILEGDNGSPAAAIPVAPVFDTPPPAVVGLFERLDDLVSASASLRRIPKKRANSWESFPQNRERAPSTIRVRPSKPERCPAALSR